MVPDPGAWGFGASLVATSLHIEHIEAEDPGLVTPYWHVQSLLIGELDLTARRGLAPGVGIQLTVPLREVRDRIRFEDLARNPYVPPQPDTHHRNETLVHLADPTLAALFTREAHGWTIGSSVGASIPLGRTEDNPFALGRLGLPHQHIQFGTGTFDPMVALSASRAFGEFGVSASASAKLAFGANARGYQVGNRFGGELGASRKLGAHWGAHLGLQLDREEPEKWDGRIEEEGNLGRTDLMLGAGLAHGLAKLGTFALNAQIPLKTWATGEQVKYPLIASLAWTR